MTNETKVSVYEQVFPSATALAVSVFAVAIVVATLGLAPLKAEASKVGDLPDYDYSYNYVDYYDDYDYSYSYGDYYDYDYDYSYNYGYYDDYWYDYSYYDDYYYDYSYYDYYYDEYWYDYSYYDDYYYDHRYYNDYYSYDIYDDYYYYDYGCGYNCNPPPYDECPNLSGYQAKGYKCYPDKPQKPDTQPICDLDASKTTIEEGESTTLHWSSTNASSATLTSFGSVSTSGSRTVSPTSDKTYTLTVRDNDGDEDTCTVHINVEEDEDDEEPWCRLEASDRTVEEGDRITLEWDTRNAVYASINQGIGRVDEDGGEERVTIDDDDDITFRMTVRNRDGDEDTCSVTVRVDEDNDFSSLTFTGGPVNNPPVVYLSQIPYTGIEDITPSMWGFIITLIGLLGFGSYHVFIKRREVA